MRFILGSTRRLHPLARIALMLVGAALFCALLLLGAIALAILVAVGAVTLLVRRWQQPRGNTAANPRPTHDPRVLEGTYVVLDKSSQH